MEYLKVQEHDGDQIIEIPEKIMDDLGWNEYTVLSIELIDGKIHLTHKTEWTVEEITKDDMFDLVMNDVVKNRQTHFIFHDGHKYALLPYETYKKTDEEII